MSATMVLWWLVVWNYQTHHWDRTLGFHSYAECVEERDVYPIPAECLSAKSAKPQDIT